VAQLVVTELYETVFSDSANVTGTETTEPSTSGSSQKMPTIAALVHRKPLKRKRAMPQPQDSMKVLIQLQNRELQCEREQLWIERENWHHSRLFRAS